MFEFTVNHRLLIGSVLIRLKFYETLLCGYCNTSYLGLFSLGAESVDLERMWYWILLKPRFVHGVGRGVGMDQWSRPSTL